MGEEVPWRVGKRLPGWEAGCALLAGWGEVASFGGDLMETCQGLWKMVFEILGCVQDRERVSDCDTVGVTGSWAQV